MQRLLDGWQTWQDAFTQVPNSLALMLLILVSTWIYAYLWLHCRCRLREYEGNEDL